VNNSTITVVLTELNIRVNSSAVNREPVIAFMDEDENENKLKILNVGWGKALGAKLRFGIAKADTYEDLDPDTAPATSWLRVGDILDVSDVPLENIVSSWIADAKTTDDVRAQTQKWISEGGEMVIYGELLYQNERLQPRSVRFKTRARFVGNLMHAALMLSETYGIQLKAGRRGYDIRVPIAHYMRPGEADRFAIKLMTDKSSVWDMSIDLKSIGGQRIRRTRIELETFVPNDVTSIEHTKPVSISELKPWSVLRPVELRPVELLAPARLALPPPIVIPPPPVVPPPLPVVPASPRN
jgi:hypothetical protein